MAIEDVYQHHFRLNLNNPYHLRLHRELLRVNKDVYRSKNEYVVQKLYEGVFGNDDSLGEEIVPDYYITKQLEDKITLRVMERILEKLVGKIGTEINVEDKSSGEEAIEDELANAALGYFDDWGDEDA